jgi:hypothetical protein
MKPLSLIAWLCKLYFNSNIVGNSQGINKKKRNNNPRTFYINFPVLIEMSSSGLNRVNQSISNTFYGKSYCLHFLQNRQI